MDLLSLRLSLNAALDRYLKSYCSQSAKRWIVLKVFALRWHAIRILSNSLMFCILSKSMVLDIASPLTHHSRWIKKINDVNIYKGHLRWTTVYFLNLVFVIHRGYSISLFLFTRSDKTWKMMFYCVMFRWLVVISIAETYTDHQLCIIFQVTW